MNARRWKATSKARHAAHRAIDGLWESGAMTRTEVYAWLKSLGFGHIGEMTKSQCHSIIAAVEARDA